MYVLFGGIPRHNGDKNKYEVEIEFLIPPLYKKYKYKFDPGINIFFLKNCLDIQIRLKKLIDFIVRDGRK